jgi:hypothetical protein
MLCTIELTDNILSNKKVRHIVDVPDELFMMHMAVYGTFKPAMLSDVELRDCTWIGLAPSMVYIGPAEEKETK